MKKYFLMLTLCATYAATNAQSFDRISKLNNNIVVKSNVNLGPDASYVVYPPREKTAKAPERESETINHVEVLQAPVRLSNGERCISITAKTEQGVHCKIYYLDMNGDGEIQPRKELRAICSSDNGEPCEIIIDEMVCATKKIENIRPRTGGY